jgi:hypothetical protein
LRGTPEGDAVAEALHHYRAVSNLTKPYGGDARGPMAKLWNLGVKVTPIPKLIADAMTIKPGDANASRIRGADKAIDQLPRFQKLASNVGPSPVGPALDTFQQRVADSFTAKPAPTGPKLNPLDQALSDQIDAGIPGSHNATNAYARILGVKPQDVLRALGTIEVPEAFKFEAHKLTNGYNVARNAQQVLIPRLRKALTDDGTITARAGEEATAQAAPASAASGPSAAQAAPAASTAGQWRDIQRPTAHAEGKARYQEAFDDQRTKLSSNPLFKEISAAAADGLEHIKHGEKTTESAMRYFDDQLGPHLRNLGFFPDDIAEFRHEVSIASLFSAMPNMQPLPLSSTTYRPAQAGPTAGEQDAAQVAAGPGEATSRNGPRAPEGEPNKPKDAGGVATVGDGYGTTAQAVRPGPKTKAR